MEKVVIVEACRTAVGTMGKTLKSLSAEDLAVWVMKGIIDRSGVKPEMIDQVIMGQCRQSSDSSNLARVAALRSGIPCEVPANTVMVPAHPVCWLWKMRWHPYNVEIVTLFWPEEQNQ